MNGVRTAVSAIISLVFIITAITVCVFAQSDEQVFLAENSKITSDEYGTLKRELKKVYPQAVEEAVQFFGDEKVRKIVEKFNIMFMDPEPDNPCLCSNFYFYRARTYGETLRLYGPQFLAGNSDLKRHLSFEMITRVIEKQYSFDEFKDMPRYLIFSLVHFRQGCYREQLAMWLNSGKKLFEIDRLMLKKYKRKAIRKSLFGYCFHQEYGEEAFQKVIEYYYRGKGWKKVLKKAAGENHKEVLKKCDECIKHYLADQFERSGSYKDVYQAFIEKKYEETISLGRKLLEEYPDSIWRQHCTFNMARAYLETSQFEIAEEMFEQIRTGKLGQSCLCDDASYWIVIGLLKEGKCQTARDRHKTYSRYYPAFWYRWKNDLDQAFREHCP